MGIAALAFVLAIFFIPFNAVALILTFKAIDPHLNKAEMRLGFFLALKLFAVIEFGHVLAVAAMVSSNVASYELITLGVQLFGCILLWKYFVLDVGTFVLIYFVFGLINALLGGLILGFMAGLFRIAI